MGGGWLGDVAVVSVDACRLFKWFGELIQILGHVCDTLSHSIHPPPTNLSGNPNITAACVQCYLFFFFFFFKKPTCHFDVTSLTFGPFLMRIYISNIQHRAWPVGSRQEALKVGDESR